MVLYLCLRWWYGAGWYWVLRSVLMERSNWIMETFSVPELLKTLFAPFRQTYAGKLKGSLDVQIRAFFDRLISRVIGFLVRSILLFMAFVGLLVVFIVAVVSLIVWPFIPLLPVIGIVMIGRGVGV